MHFEDRFDQFSSYLKTQNYGEFISMNNPYFKKFEEYKLELNKEANSILDSGSWKKSDIGNGIIVGKVIDAIELKKKVLFIIVL